MRTAYLFTVTQEYGQFVYLVFADSPKEASTVLYHYDRRYDGTRKCIMTVKADYRGEDVVDIGGHCE